MNNYSGKAISIGRDPNCDIVINDPRVSRNHAVLSIRNGEYHLRDNDSLNGVFVNGQRVREAMVRPGDRINIANAFDLSWDRIKDAITAGNQPAGYQQQGIPSGTTELRIGRASDNSIVIDDPNVSRHHAMIRVENGSYHIRDLDSRNGVFVNGTRVSSARISPADNISLGRGHTLSWNLIQSGLGVHAPHHVHPQGPPEQRMPEHHQAINSVPSIPEGKAPKAKGNAGTWIAAILLGVLVLAGGAYMLLKNRDRAPDLNIPPILSENAVPVASESVLEASPGQVVLASNADPASYQSGKVIASGVSDGAPYGFLRKVTGHTVQDGKIVVSTADATLEDAFDQLGLSIRTNLDPGGLASSRPLTDGVVFAPQMAISVSPLASTLHAQEVYGGFEYDPMLFKYKIDKSIPLGNGVSMNISGDLDMSLGFEMDAKIELLGTVYAKSGTIARSAANLKVEVTGAFAHKAKIELYEHKFAPVTVTLPLLPFWPIVLHPKVVVVLEIDANGSSSVTTSVAADAGFNAGLEYRRSKWKPYTEKNFTFKYQAPELDASMRVYLSAGPRFELNFYDMAGPYAYARGFLELNANVNSDPAWTLDGGYRVDVGARLKALQYDIEYAVQDVITQKQRLASAANKASPIPSIPIPEPATEPVPEPSPPVSASPPPDPRPIFVSIINGNWNSVRELADMFEESVDGSRSAVLDIVGSEPTKKDRVDSIHMNFLGGFTDTSSSSIRISVNDLQISYPSKDVATLRFTETAVQRMFRILAWKNVAQGLTNINGRNFEEEMSHSTNSLNAMVLENLRGPKHFILENGTWKCMLSSEL
jgi:pSer/pThr/pTyr-binding forkhead associated (FHA) protein